MYDPRDNLETVTRIPLKPDAKGRGLPVPPLIPLVAVISLLVGLSIGSQISVDRRPTATSPVANDTPSPHVIEDPAWVAPASFEVAVTVPPIDEAATPPADGLPLEKALVALMTSGFRGSSSVVISATVTQLGNMGGGGAGAADEWVWVFVVSGDFGDVAMTGSTCTAPPSPDSAIASPRASGPPPAATSAVASSAPAAEQADPCARPLATATVILDYRSGLLLQAWIFEPEASGGG